MRCLNIEEIENRVLQLAKRINAPISIIPNFGYTKDFGHPHIEVNGDGYHFIVVERGTEWERKTTERLSELLYWTFEHITSSMAWDFERQNRIPNQDARILAFKKQLELMDKIDHEYAQKLRYEINQILTIAPYQNPVK